MNGQEPEMKCTKKYDAKENDITNIHIYYTKISI